MNRAELNEILQCLPKYKTRFYYFRDRYALLLLRLATEGRVSKKELKGSQFSRLLDKAVVKEVLARNRRGPLSADVFDAYWPVQYECYFLTLGIWGSRESCSWQQTSRNGFNLVLQLNFSSRHDEPYRKLVDPEDRRPFELGGHPVAEGSFNTLAWSRVDLDLASGEALIEEIQTDWIREALRVRKFAAHRHGRSHYWGMEFQNDRLIRYVDTILRQHEAMWDEAMMSATLWFLREELGVRNIYYHTYRSGAMLKGISGRQPPRSLYTRLPKRFCFSETDTVPGMLRRNVRSAARKNRLLQARFHTLTL